MKQKVINAGPGTKGRETVSVTRSKKTQKNEAKKKVTKIRRAKGTDTF